MDPDHKDPTGNLPDEDAETSGETANGDVQPLPEETVEPSFIAPPEPPTKEIMEVHHHGHVHSDKKWKEYLFQFFMLFLAVFCGFLAEYQLEQTIERHREKEYIESFINDLKADTAQISFRNAALLYSANGMDSLFEAAKDLSNPINRRLFCVYYISHVPRATLMVLSEGTMQQLKHAGGLRLIKNRSAVDSILQYDAYNSGIVTQGERYRDNVVKALDASDYIFNWRIFGSTTVAELEKSDVTPFVNPSDQQMQYFLNRIEKQRGTSIFYRRQLEQQYERAARLIPFLEKLYNL